MAAELKVQSAGSEVALVARLSTVGAWATVIEEVTAAVASAKLAVGTSTLTCAKGRLSVTGEPVRSMLPVTAPVSYMPKNASRASSLAAPVAVTVTVGPVVTLFAQSMA